VTAAKRFAAARRTLPSAAVLLAPSLLAWLLLLGPGITTLRACLPPECVENPCAPTCPCSASCPCPEAPCPSVAAGTSIQVEAVPAATLQVGVDCENPEGSESWTAADWAGYFGLSVSACDLDSKTTYEYVRVADCCSLVEHVTEIDGGGINVTWSGGPVDVTTEGDYTLLATVKNSPVEYDQCGDPPQPVPRWAYEEEALSFTVTVADLGEGCCPGRVWISGTP
jgi:hypothetical protein